MENTTNVTLATQAPLTNLRKRGRPSLKDPNYELWNNQNSSVQKDLMEHNVHLEECEKNQLNCEKMSAINDSQMDPEIILKRIRQDKMDLLQEHLEKLQNSLNSPIQDAFSHTSPSTPSLKLGCIPEQNNETILIQTSKCDHKANLTTERENEDEDGQNLKRQAKLMQKDNIKSQRQKRTLLQNIRIDSEALQNEECKNNLSSNNGDQQDDRFPRRTRRQILPSKKRGYDNTITTEEERMIKLAIKNSIAEIQNSNESLDYIEEMKVFYPTEEEFRSPITYIEKLIKEEGAEQYGVVKIVPPQSFKPALAFDMSSEKKMPTRFQFLQELSQGKPFSQNPEGQTFQEFAKKSQALEKDADGSDYQQIEKAYWNFVENQLGPEMKVEYAADLPTQIYGSGFGHRDQKINDKNAEKYRDHPWNLNNLSQQPGSLMQFQKNKEISGINTPWLYIGMKYSTFCWHYEDLMLFSINYNHWGKPKLWYGVPSSDREKFEKAVKQKVALLFKKDPNILLDIITMISPGYLVNNRVKVFKTLQMPGEFILTFPGAYHSGFSTGLNIGEAVNFVSKSWIDNGLQCQAIYRKSREKIPVFPVDWLIIENVRNLSQIKVDLDTKQNLKKALKGIIEQEIEVRNEIEGSFKEYYSENAPVITSSYKKQSKASNTSSDHTVESKQSTTKKKVFKILKNRDLVPEDQNQCNYCTDFAYLSMIKCTIHNFTYCLNHQLLCGCPIDSLKLIYRYSTLELLQFYQSIKQSCKEEQIPLVTTKASNGEQIFNPKNKLENDLNKNEGSNIMINSNSKDQSNKDDSVQQISNCMTPPIFLTEKFQGRKESKTQSCEESQEIILVQRQNIKKSNMSQKYQHNKTIKSKKSKFQALNSVNSSNIKNEDTHNSASFFNNLFEKIKNEESIIAQSESVLNQIPSLICQANKLQTNNQIGSTVDQQYEILNISKVPDIKSLSSSALDAEELQKYLLSMQNTRIKRKIFLPYAQ